MVMKLKINARKAIFKINLSKNKTTTVEELNGLTPQY